MDFLNRPIKLWSTGTDNNPKWVSITPAGIIVVLVMFLAAAVFGVPALFRRFA
jgi:hypothetical protein